jgi:hypothetical protein
MSFQSFLDAADNVVSKITDISYCDVSNCICYDKNNKQINTTQEQLNALCQIPFFTAFDCGKIACEYQTWPIVGVVVGVILLILLIIFIVYLARRKKS